MRVWPADLAFILFIGAAAFGVLSGLPVGWMLLGTVMALIIWDLLHWLERLSNTEQVEGRLKLKRAHLRRLLVTSTVGLLAGGAALSLKVELSFGWALLLVLFAAWGLSRTISSLRRASD